VLVARGIRTRFEYAADLGRHHVRVARCIGQPGAQSLLGTPMTVVWRRVEIPYAFRIRVAYERIRNVVRNCAKEIAQGGAAESERRCREPAMQHAHWVTFALRAPVFALGAARRAHAGIRRAGFSG
jgi:hypothetical protein